MKGCTRFIYILKQLVDDPETNDIIGWNEKGDGFIIFDRNRLCQVLIRYPCSKNFSTFHRQLNLYGFKQIRSIKFKENTMSYKHKYFLRNNKESLKKIQRSEEEDGTENVDVGTQTQQSTNNIVKNDHELRVNVLEQVIESMREEIVDLRTGFHSLHTKLNNQQNLFYAVFRAMNASQNKSDVLFNVFVKHENLRPNNVGQSSLSTNSFTLNPDYSLIYPTTNNNRELRQILPNTEMEAPREGHTQTIEQTYEMINNNFNYNPAFCYDYPIFVQPMDNAEENVQPICNSVQSIDSLLNTFNDNNEVD